MKCVDIQLAEITVPQGMRKPKPSVVKALSMSILEIGLQHPIGLTSDRRLIYGRHRLEAYRALTWKTIPAVIHDVDDLHAELMTIDENLHRHELTAAEQAKSLARRKAIYLALHPETAKGKTPGNQYTGQKRETDNMSFSQDTASKTGKSARTIERDVALGEALDDEAAVIIAETPAGDNKSDLKVLAALPPEQQREAARKVASGEVKSVRAAVQPGAPKTRAKENRRQEPSPIERMDGMLDRQADEWRLCAKQCGISLAEVVRAVRSKLTELDYE